MKLNLRKLFGGPVAVVTKPSVRAEEAAARLNGKLAISPATKKAVDAIYAEVSRRTDPYPSGRYKTVGEHFRKASSSGDKIAILEEFVRFQEARSILEIGTAYGISGVALGLAQQVPQLVTMDLNALQAGIALPHLRGALGEGVVSLVENKDIAIPRLVAERRRFDLVFHDGGHNGDAYVNDFNALYPNLDMPCTFIVDDIGWDEGEKRRAESIQRSERTCFEGWKTLVADSRVAGAVVVDHSIGVLYLD